MRIVFSMNAGLFTMYYLDQPPPGTEDVNAGTKIISDMPMLAWTKGLVELYHVHGTENVDMEACTGNMPPNLGFAHLGITIPDVDATLERLKAANVPVLKDLGVCTRQNIPLLDCEEQRGIGKGQFHPNFAWIFGKFAMVADPVGSLIIILGDFDFDIPPTQDEYSV